MSGGNISGNTSSDGGGVYVSSSGNFTMSNAARIALDNPVYLGSNKKIIIDGGFSGSDTVARLNFGTAMTWIGKSFLQWKEGQSGALPVSRFDLGGWSADSSGVVYAEAAPLTPGIQSGAYLNAGDIHFYRVSPTLNATYNFTRSGGTSVYMSAAWADGSGVFFTGTTAAASAGITASKTTDIILMVYNGSGAYTIQCNQQ
jgi:hypothetical protein